MRAPKDAGTQCKLGFAQARAGDMAAAEAHYGHAIALDPSMVPARSNLATLLGARGAAEEAIVQLQEVATLAPEDPQAFYNLGRALEAGEQGGVTP